MSSAYDKKLSSLKKTAERQIKLSKIAKDSAQRQLGFWSDDFRATPNALIRGALFSVRSTRNVVTKMTPIYSDGNYEVKFKGETFNQLDLKVINELWHLTRKDILGEPVSFSAHSLLTALGRGTSGNEHDQLNEEITRLMGGVVEIKSKKNDVSYMGTLISEGYRDEFTKAYSLKLNKKIAQIFDDGFTQVNNEQRKNLGRNLLAQWLFNYYSSHIEPFPLKVETIHKYCGSTAKVLRSFRASLKIALDLLVSVGFLAAWSINEKSDTVTVVKTKQAQIKN
jgi:hypothetical protein